jgi:hypothetical protein
MANVCRATHMNPKKSVKTLANFPQSHEAAKAVKQPQAIKAK